MDPNSLIPPANPLGYPAPFWFIEFFKVFGFTLHMIPMHLWYAGLILIMITGLFGKGTPLQAVKRLAHGMPVIVALGINLGIIPLLFTQVAYYQFYYPAGILIAWPWISVIGLLLCAYYSVYIYTVQIRKGTVTKSGRIAGWVSTVLFIVIGFLFANNFSLMANPGRWTEIFMATSVGGSPHGLALNTGDPTLLPRWLMMFGLALTTVSIFMVIDAVFHTKKNNELYRTELGKFTFIIYSIGILIFGAMGTWYIFGTLPETTAQKLWEGSNHLALFFLTAASPGAVWFLLLLQYKGLQKTLAVFAGIGQFLVLALNAVSRQLVQNIEIGKYVDVSQGKVTMQWSPMFLFLISFVTGLWIIWWMLKQVRSARLPEQSV